MHEEKGVKFVLNASPEEFIKNEAGLLTHVVVNGEQLEADVCVLGVGVEASTGFLVIFVFDVSVVTEFVAIVFRVAMVKWLPKGLMLIYKSKIHIPVGFINFYIGKMNRRKYIGKMNRRKLNSGKTTNQDFKIHIATIDIVI